MDIDGQVITAHLLLETRTCRKCNKEKNLLDDFYRSRADPTKASSYAYECKVCTKIRARKYDHEHREHKRDLHLQRYYGISADDFNMLLEAQDHQCAICFTTNPGGKSGRFNVDHDHKTGKVRGLLCKSCNIALGEVGDNIHTLKNMIEYLHSK